jgi:oligopeptide transport system substrate-binding protein
MYVSTSGNNNAQLRSSEYDDLIARSTAAAADPAERMKLLHDAEDLLMDDYVVGPLYYYTNKYMMNPEIEGLYYTPLGYFLFNGCYTA